MSRQRRKRIQSAEGISTKKKAGRTLKRIKAPVGRRLDAVKLKEAIARAGQENGEIASES